MKHFLAILACSTFIIHGAAAENFTGFTTLKKENLNDATFHGPANLEEVKAKSLVVQGPLEFHGLTVENDTKVMGPVSGSDKGTFGSLKVAGPFEGKNITSTKFEVKGPVEVTELTVNGKADIAGPLMAQQSHFQDLKVKGPVEVDNITVKGETNIIGPLDAKKSHFQNLEIKGDDVSLDDVDVKDIVIKGRTSNEQVLQLKGKTIVSGTITFDSGRGVVEQGKEVKIQGEVKGGTVNKK